MDEQKKEWDDSEEVNLPQETWDSVWTTIKRKRKSSARILAMKRLAAAASIVALVTAGLTLLNNDKKTVPILVKAKIAEPQQKLLVNTTQKTITAYLPDSSIVLLSPAAIVKYYVPFINHHRDFYLEGEARFNVKKDKTMPFTVYAGELATTALGTEFTINTTGKNATVVKLHSGKVMVRNNSTASASLKKDIYMEAGQQLTFNTLTMTASVGKIHSDKIASLKKPAATTAAHNNEMVFVNTPLSEVISKLERHYRYNIKYNHDEIADMNFTGNISKNDSLNIVLKVLAQMNNLEMIHENENYELRKSK